jgi:MarR family transcriptional regulator, 2-MHQ and catechol-resistance regulon repressor
MPSAAKDLEPVSSLKLWTVLSRCYEATQVFVERTIAPEQLGFSDFMVLEVLLHKGPLPMSIIAQKVLRTNASITSAIDRLEARKLVSREVSETDRRVWLITLTEPGTRLIRSIFRSHKKQMDDLMANLSQAERSAMYAGLKKLGFEAQARTAER